MRRLWVTCILLACVWACPGVVDAESSPSPTDSPYLTLVIGQTEARSDALAQIDAQWQPYTPVLLLEAMRLARDRQVPVQIVAILEKRTGQTFGFDVEAWWQWVWEEKPHLPAEYAVEKARLYSVVDHRFRRYFHSQWLPTARIRLDEIRWGGVSQDGIPPLRHPEMITAAAAASWLEDDDIVFGVVLGDEVHAYPRRILAWHELLTTTIGGEPVAGVYCTLCGTMIVYKTRVDSVEHDLGTSGFLFRSNKLMYDRKTQSLWSTLWGEPVLGPLADSGIRLQRHPVVTTTWSAWHDRHPETLVLSHQTGHIRDYGEGVAYKDYFETDDLMFSVPRTDRRLRNKDEILGLLSPDAPPLAISDRFLRKHPVYHDQHGDQQIVIFTDRSGAHRVYASQDIRFNDLDDAGAVDSLGRIWRIEEDGLYRETDTTVLPRLAVHRAFWFGWFSAFPETRLIR